MRKAIAGRQMLAATVAIAALCIGTSARAQDGPQDTASQDEAGPADDQEDIYVTAQKRPQLLIDVPQAVTVVSGQTLERQQASSFQDYLKLVPGLQLEQDTPGSGRLVLRGINTGGVASTVAVYVDETPFGSSSGLVNGSVLAGDFDTFDVARIEVLRGPQGTLYGASSLGGVLKFVTNAPQTDRVVARGRASIESVDGGEMGYSAAAALNVPLGKTFAVRGTGYYRKVGGFVDSIGTAGSDLDNNINDSRSFGGRASALFAPRDEVSIRLTAILQNLETGASSLVESNPTTLRPLYGRLSQSQFVPAFTDVRYRVYNGTASVDIGFADLTSSTSYSTLDQQFRSDFTSRFSGLLQAIFGQPNEFFQNQETGYKKFTQEVRLASDSNDRFEWLLGGYFTSEKGLILQHFEAVAPGTFTPLVGLPPLGDARLDSRYKEYAGFANATVHFGERFDLTFGGRYSKNRQRASQTLSGALVGNASFPVARSSEDVFTYSVAPKIKFGERTAVYARVAKGFRPGGPNVLPPSAPPGTQPSYNSDSLVSYEVGLKTETRDRRFALDVAVFHIDWKDIQLLASVGGVGFNVNGGGAKSDGLEFTATARPTRGLSLSANGAYIRARLSDDTPPVVGGLDGDRLPYNPKFSFGFSGDYEWSMGPTTTAYVGGSLRTVSSQTGDYDLAFRTANGRQRQLPAYEVVDLRAGLDFERFGIEVFAKNVGNSHGQISSGGLGNFPAGAIGTGVIRPRTIGVAISAGF